MPKPPKGSVLVLVGTRKGAFVFRSDAKRKNWRIDGPHFKGTQVHHLAHDPRDAGTLLAAATSDWWGPAVHRSRDWGKNWEASKDGIRYGADSGLSVTRVWNVCPGRASEPGVVYAGVEPAGLFRSEDGGASWTENLGLNRHATRSQWTPGGGGLMVHTIVPDPSRADRMHIAISVAGAFRTDDGGRTWLPRNKGTIADFRPDKYPEVGMCVHKLVMAPGKPDLLYQQNHCGVYRSEDAGDSWTDISKGLPSRFGFGIAMHPHDTKTIWVIPAIGPEARYCPSGCLAAYRSTNGGRTWQKQAKGLPARNAYVLVLREGMASDSCDPAGVYFGTQAGQLFYTRNEGKEWHLMADSLPSILSVEAAVI